MTLDTVCHNTDFHLNLFKWQGSILGAMALSTTAITIMTLDAYPECHYADSHLIKSQSSNFCLRTRDTDTQHNNKNEPT
jgi:hypothetical protein